MTTGHCSASPCECPRSCLVLTPMETNPSNLLKSKNDGNHRKIMGKITEMLFLTYDANADAELARNLLCSLEHFYYQCLHIPNQEKIIHVIASLTPLIPHRADIRKISFCLWFSLSIYRPSGERNSKLEGIFLIAGLKGMYR